MYFDGEYAWMPGLGRNNAEGAFEVMKVKVVETIEAVLRDDLDAISRVDGYDFFRWKVAYLYAPDRVFPMFSKDRVRMSARELHMGNYANSSYAAMHRFIMTHLPPGEDGQACMERLYALFEQRGITGPRYFIVGSKYRNGVGGFDAKYEDMIARNAICVGYLESHDLTAHYLGPFGPVENLIATDPESQEPIRAKEARTALRHFLSMRAGDIVAIKEYGRPNDLLIAGYAVVVERDGAVYRHDPDGLGHLLNVDFIERDAQITVKTSRRDTIHEVDTNDAFWPQLFGPIQQMVEKLADTEEDLADDDSGGTQTKNTDPRKRSGWVGGEYKREHDRIQKSYFELLKRKGVHDFVTMEKRKVDIYGRSRKELHLYEVKPYGKAFWCIREAIGQLLAYALQGSGTKYSIHLHVVGPAPLDHHAQDLIDFVRSHTGFVLDYVQHVVTEVGEHPRA